MTLSFQKCLIQQLKLIEFSFFLILLYHLKDEILLQVGSPRSIEVAIVILECMSSHTLTGAAWDELCLFKLSDSLFRMGCYLEIKSFVSENETIRGRSQSNQTDVCIRENLYTLKDTGIWAHRKDHGGCSEKRATCSPRRETLGEAQPTKILILEV